MIPVGFKGLLKTWRIDDDLMTCRGCGRSLHVARDGEVLNHGDGCENEGVWPKHPWAALSYILSDENRAVTEPSPTPDTAGAE